MGIDCGAKMMVIVWVSIVVLRWWWLVGIYSGAKMMGIVWVSIVVLR